MRKNLTTRIRTALYRWAVGFTAVPVCGEDCDCREHYLADCGVSRQYNDWIDADTPGELLTDNEEDQ